VRNRDAYRVYLAYTIAGSFLSTLYFTVATIYRVQVAGLNPLQLVLVGTVMESAIFIFQVPTGVVADVFSRKLSIVIGQAIIGGAFLVEASFPRFPLILAAQALWGLGYTFTSGATEAWVAGEVGEDHIGSAFLRATQVGTIGSLVAIFASVALASMRLNLPMLIAGGLNLGIAVVLALAMPETGFRPTPRAERSGWQQMGDTLKAGVKLVRRRPALLTILGIGLFIGLYSEGYDRLGDAHFLKDLRFPPIDHLSYIVWFGIMDVGAGLLTIAATEIVRRRVDLRSHLGVARALFAMVAMLSAGVITFGLARNFYLAVVAVWGIAVLRSVINPLYDAWIAQHTDPNVRATVISMAGQVDAFGQITGGPAIGLLGTLRGLRVALVAAGALLSPALLLIARTIRRPPVTAGEGKPVEAVPIEVAPANP
jgi:MFS transporter, DHA3 family, tetracycline resistance protein